MNLYLMIALKKVFDNYGYLMDTHTSVGYNAAEKYIEENGIKSKDGAEFLLSYLKENGYKVALATATPFDRAKRYLEKLGLLRYFDEVVCSTMVQNGKPEPDIYLLAAERLAGVVGINA